MSLSVIVDSNNVIEVRHLTNSVTEEVDTGATVELTIRDSNGSAISGHTWPLTMSHADSGTYRAFLDDALAVTQGSTYTATIDVTGTSGLVRKFVRTVKAVSG